MLLILLNVGGLVLILLGLFVVCMLKNGCTGFLFMGAGNLLMLIMSLINGIAFLIILYGVLSLICGWLSYNCYKDEKKIGK